MTTGEAAGAAAGDGDSLVIIPESAVVTVGAERYVFVEVAPRTFERRPVMIESLTPPGSAAPTSSQVVVRSGLAPGARIAIRGAFTLQSEFAKSKLGESDG